MKIDEKNMTPGERAGLLMRRKKYLGTNADGTSKTVRKIGLRDAADALRAEGEAEHLATMREAIAAGDRVRAELAAPPAPPIPAPPPPPVTHRQLTREILAERCAGRAETVRDFADAQNEAWRRIVATNPTTRATTRGELALARKRELMRANPRMSDEQALDQAYREMSNSNNGPEAA